ncbi:MAG: hypothetical protein OEW35_13390 [Gammaproteobacteria bacterium]|nr:hypothetical protein [Gammaproteobacteria bacterium]MDH4257049.1 hypothetical protein [Gammaproteobacteria bacterium]MDH5311298.1 hypothetical protein [Gammaproteobacteria bacterium]
MDTSWIPVFVMILSECSAPAGKSVCQQRELHLQFVEQEQCELALRELVELKSLADNVIVDRERSRCERSARSIDTFESFAAIDERYAGIRKLEDGVAKQTADFTLEAHQKRLADLQTCEATSGTAPCKIGDIIIEPGTGETLEVWRREP